MNKRRTTSVIIYFEKETWKLGFFSSSGLTPLMYSVKKFVTNIFLSLSFPNAFKAKSPKEMKRTAAVIVVR